MTKKRLEWEMSPLAIVAGFCFGGNNFLCERLLPKQ